MGLARGAHGIMARTEVAIQDPYPLGWPEILTVAHTWYMIEGNSLLHSSVEPQQVGTAFAHPALKVQRNQPVFVCSAGKCGIFGGSMTCERCPAA